MEQFINQDWDGRYVEYDFWNSCFEAACKTTSLEIFQKLYPRAENYLDTDDYSLMDLPSGSLMDSVVSRGVVPILDYLFNLYCPGPTSHYTDLLPKGSGTSSLLQKAARHGQQETVVYLLDKGFPVLPAALEAAVRHGNPALVDLLLKRAGFVVTATGALSIAVEKEDETVLRMLLEAGAKRLLCSDCKEGLVAEARDQGLESMEKLLREHWVE
ncbi:protein kinase [Apiospora aurea]|uniref:Protein kinase n=1 Tax=Apiospora aurea TaxID=335848 RepID=A0ABR1PRP1_9PEZI